MSELIERLTAAADRLDSDGDEHGAVNVIYEAACELRKLRASLREAEAALVEAVEAAPVGRLDIGRNDCDDADMVEIVIDPNRVSHLQYQRVRLLPEMAAEGRE